MHFFIFIWFVNMNAQSIVLMNAFIIDGKGNSIQPNMAIVIQGSSIVNICKMSDLIASKNYTQIDLKGKYVIPGLIEGHAHLQNFPDKQLKYALDCGITSIRSMADDASYIQLLEEDKNDGKNVYPDIYYSAAMAGVKFFQLDPRPVRITPSNYILGEAPWMRLINDKSNFSKIVQDARDCGVTGIKLYAYLTPIQVKNITEEAHRKNLKVWSHPYLNYSNISTIASSGVDLITHATMIVNGKGGSDVHSIDYNFISKGELDSVITILRKNDIAVELTFDMIFHSMAKGISDSLFQRLKDVHIEVAKKFWKAGLKIIAGTDMPLPQKEDEKPALFIELQYFVNSIGMTPIEAISCATYLSAKVLGLENTFGSIEIGKKANIVILDKNPGMDIKNLNYVYLVIKNGQIIKKK